MKLIADTHTHTLASTHAFSTVLENFDYASQIGLKYLAITDHAPGMPDAPHLWHFLNLRMLPDEIKGVKILRGVEVNITDEKGNLDMSSEILHTLNWVVASFHTPALRYTLNKEQATSAYIEVAKNPYVDVIGHSGTAEFVYDYEKVIPIFKQYSKLVEINENSFIVRDEGKKNCIEIAKLCKQHQVKVVVNSDAHFAYAIGGIDRAMRMLEEIDFPQELIVNASIDSFENYLATRGRTTV